MVLIRGRLDTLRSGIDEVMPIDSIIFADTLTLEVVWVALRSRAKCILTAHGSPHSHAGIQLQALQGQLAWSNGIQRQLLPQDGSVVQIEVKSLRDQWSVPDKKCPLVLRDGLQVVTCMNPFRRYRGILSSYIAEQLGLGVMLELETACRGFIGHDGRMWFRSDLPWSDDLAERANDPDRRRSWLDDRWDEYRELYDRLTPRHKLQGGCERGPRDCLDQVLRSGVLLHWHYSSVIASLRPSEMGSADTVRVVEIARGPIYEWVRQIGLPQRMDPSLWTAPLGLPAFIPARRSGSPVEGEGEVAEIMDLKEWRLLLIQALISRVGVEGWSGDV